MAALRSPPYGPRDSGLYVPTRPAAPFQMGADTASLRVRSPAPLDHQREKAERLNSLKASIFGPGSDHGTGGLADDHCKSKVKTELVEDPVLGPMAMQNSVFWRGVQSISYWDVGDDGSITETKQTVYRAQMHDGTACRLVGEDGSITETKRRRDWNTCGVCKKRAREV